MYQVETQKIQSILNYLQLQPYQETIGLAEALVATQQSEDKRIISKELMQLLIKYLSVKPLGQVYDYMKFLKSLVEQIPTITIDDIKEPEGFDNNISNVK